MSATIEQTDTTRAGGRHVVLAILALSVGGFAIGTTEFVTMGLLPQIADGVEASIPKAGHLISAYAVGVVVGAPLLALFGAKLPRKGLLLVLAGWLLVGNGLSALSAHYGMLMFARFFAGLPHGAYFGVASLVAASLVPAERKGRAVSQVMLGLAIANIVGVPAATWLGQNLGWRSAYWAVSVIAALTLVLVWRFVPHVAADPDASSRRELQAFRRPQVWLTVVTGAVGFGGMFAVYSYIAPIVTQVGGLSDSAVPVFLLVFGLGMTTGTWVGGIGADWSVFRSLVLAIVGTLALMLIFFATARTGWPAIVVLYLIAVATSVVAVNLQLRLMSVAGEAQTVGAALNHAALNLANALGAWLGGLVIAAGLGYNAPALVGAGLSVLGLVALGISGNLHVRTTRRERDLSGV
ncbi:putative permease of the major facilitator superfamily protein [Marmoricola endophyticus]|uniref:Permease of the major facilitator superfamily protein n=1 Tax=Marmoricola endophyticus TaxID=2040280 RepID=A0A917F467_9ACTN|nr:MFS transporter [Marmoricola endophyticus]GGF40856.1 putative permease of the major facilitator superfamily protein [Marmoricola endophyticus]